MSRPVHTLKFILFLMALIPRALSADGDILTLQDAMTLAVSRNSSLAGSRYERENLQRQLHLKMREFLPQVEFGYSGNNSVTVGSSDSRVEKLSLGIDQLVFSGGRELARVRSYRRELDLKNLSAAAERDSLMHNVLLAYVDVLKYQRIGELKEQSYQILLKQKAIALKEYELGESRRIDYLDIELEAAGAGLSLKDTAQKQLESRYTLASLLFYPLDDLPFLAGTLNEEFQGRFLEQAENAAFMESMKGMALGNNRDILDRQFQVFQARQQLRDSRLNWIPVIEANADLSVSGQEYPLTEPAFSLGLSFRFDVPLLPSTVNMQAGQSNPDEYNRTLSTTTGVADNLEALRDPLISANSLSLKKMDWEETRRSVAFQVQSLVRQIQLSGREIDLQRERLKLLEEKLVILEMQVSLGEITRLKLVEAQVEYANQRIALIESLVNLYTSEESLKQLCGIMSDPLDEKGLIR